MGTEPMPDEVSEVARAAQETAKTVRTGIEATQELGRFVSRITTEPLETVMGILNDKLQFVRWERKLRLAERGRQILDQRGIQGPLRPIPYKLALPIIENASLEDNDELQDLWANLIASAVDPKFEGLIRAAYIDIIRQLEVIDVHLLNAVYESYQQWLEERLREGKEPGSGYCLPIHHKVYKNHIIERLGISSSVYDDSTDNLIRVRCVGLYFYHSGEIFITFLGVSFVEACTRPRSRNTES
jgi:hypothetical protein